MKAKFRLLIFGLAMVCDTMFVCGQMKYSQYPNRATLNATDIMLWAQPGLTNFNMTWAQFQNLITNVDSFYATNLYAENFYPTASGIGDLSISNSITLYSNANIVRKVSAISMASTNITVDMNKPAQRLSATGSIYLLQTTNRPTDSTESKEVNVYIRNFSGASITVNMNASIGWHTNVNFPITITNGGRTVFTFSSDDPSETNILVGVKGYF